MKGPDKVDKLIVIPDAHAAPDYSNDRFDWLAAFLRDERPNVIVCLGDFADMGSLSHYDKGKRSFEGRRYQRDVDATRDAMARLGAVACDAYMTLGNHEARIAKATNDNAELDGTISHVDLGYGEHGWQVLPYQAVLSIGGFAFSHHFASGVSGRPIGGVSQGAAMVRQLHGSSVAGHSHVYDIAIQTRPDGTRVQAFVAGCYVSLDHDEGWSSATQHMWVNGITVLEGVSNGWAESWRFVSQTALRQRYARGGKPVGAPIVDLDFDDLPDTDPTQRLSYHSAAKLSGHDPSYVRRWCLKHGRTPEEFVAERSRIP